MASGGSKKRPSEEPHPRNPNKKAKTHGHALGAGSQRPGSHQTARSDASAKPVSTPNPGAVQDKQPRTGRKDLTNTQKSKGTSRPSVADENPRSRDPRSVREIRSIAAQPSDAALKDGELDVQAFLNARGFEIKALDESMRRTRTSKTSRAFQKVPFTMRRRAAAHNHKRVPKRLYRRAKREMAVDNTPTVNSKTRKPKTTRSRLRAETALRLGKLAERKRRQKLSRQEKAGKLDEQTVAARSARPKIRRNVVNDPVITVRKFRKRQIHKTWLPTHLWHTKRAKMTEPKDPLWRFAIPLTPNQKVYRPTHRAQWEKGAVAWDMSYMSTIGLVGAEKSIAHVLRGMGMLAESFWDQKGSNWRAGALHWNGTLTRDKAGIRRVVGPATIFWNPKAERRSQTTEDAEKGLRQVFIRLHPSMFAETFSELLRLAKGLTPKPYIEDLRFEIGSIDVTGPDSMEALLGTLKPYHEHTDKEEPHARRFQSLNGVCGAAALPPGSLFAFSIMDPRLNHPPKQISKEIGRGITSNSLTEALSGMKDASSPIALFDRDIRYRATRLPSQKSVNRRRGSEGPNAMLRPTQVDPQIPIVLLASRQSGGVGIWTLMMPWKCILPTWYSLMHYSLSSGGNPAFAGLNEIRQLSFEQGAPCFPSDFPATDAGMAWEIEQRRLRKRAWERMPKGKRVNYDSLDLGAGRKGEVAVGWECSYESLLGLTTPELGNGGADIEMADPDCGNTAAETNSKERGILSSIHPLARLTQIQRSELSAMTSPKPGPVPPTAVVTVKITLLTRGVADACARVYRLPTARSAESSLETEVPATNPPLSKTYTSRPNLWEQWNATIRKRSKATVAKPSLRHNTSLNIAIETRKQLLVQELLAPQTQEGTNGHPLCPDVEDLIGFVTTGSYNLRTGRADAIATLSAQKVGEELRRYRGKQDAANQICVVRNSGQSIGWIARWELV